MDIDPRQFLSKLVEKSLIDALTAKRYEEEIVTKKLKVEDYLSQFTTIPPEDILKTKAEILNVPFVTIGTTAVDPQALTFVPKNVASQYHIIPYLFDAINKKLYCRDSLFYHWRKI